MNKKDKFEKHTLAHTGLLAIALALALMAAPNFAHAYGGHWMSDNYYYDFIGGQWYRTAYWQPTGNGNGYLWQVGVVVVNQWERTKLYWNGRRLRSVSPRRRAS